MAGPTSPLKLQLRSLLDRPLVTCAAKDTIVSASRAMTARGATAIVVLGPDGRPAGIVTDRDLRERVLAVGRSPEEPVAGVMTSPVVTASPEAFVFEALLEMARRRLHHLLVVEAEQPLGIVTTDDLLGLEAAQPVAIAGAVQACASLEDLAALTPRLAGVTSQLFLEGLSGYEIGRIVSEVNDLVVQQALGFVEQAVSADLGPPPVAWCWLALGSEGRQEQTLRTDQDNAVVYDDPAPAARTRAERYFGTFAARAIEALIRLGYPPCPANAMASNPRWCQPLGVWRGYLGEWARDTTIENLMHSSIHLDFRPVTGDTRLADAMRDEVRAQVQAWRSFPRYLGRIAVSHGPPLGLFGRFKLRRENGRRGINLKLGGMLILNNALRAYAIELGLSETNTLERLEAARANGCFTESETGDIREAYETLFRLRLRHQLARLAAGEPPDNLIDPSALSRGDQQRLREAFDTIRRLQGKIEDRYFTEGL